MTSENKKQYIKDEKKNIKKTVNFTYNCVYDSLAPLVNKFKYSTISPYNCPIHN